VAIVGLRCEHIGLITSRNLTAATVASTSSAIRKATVAASSVAVAVSRLGRKLAFRELFEIAYDITADAAVRASKLGLVTKENAGR
jgi:hypothetical protein